ncbi:unnamed protein product [Lasius platythorax]|uniref:Secreted protein n=1 Tax=Lasius platythorax TaxID=488582 RepID=A0AAV2N460_9HYME
MSGGDSAGVRPSSRLPKVCLLIVEGMLLANNTSHEHIDGGTGDGGTVSPCPSPEGRTVPSHASHRARLFSNLTTYNVEARPFDFPLPTGRSVSSIDERS